MKNSCFLTLFRWKMRNMSTKSSNMFNYVIFYMSSIKLFPISNVFWQFLLFGKIQDGAQYGGHLEWRHRPPSRARENRKFKNLQGLVATEWRHGFRLAVSLPQRFNRALLIILKRLGFINILTRAGKLSASGICNITNILRHNFRQMLISFPGSPRLESVASPYAWALLGYVT